MTLKKEDLEDRLNAIIARDSGMPYPEVLETFNLEPNQFGRAVLIDLEVYLNMAEGSIHDQVLRIKSDESRRIKMFDMGEEFIRDLYSRVKSGEVRRIYTGTLVHPRNREFLAYYALVASNPLIGSNDRAEVIKGIKELTRNLKAYLHKVGLKGLMISMEGPGEKDSPLAVLRLFDKVYQEKTHDKSLFDLSQEEHLHPWGDVNEAPQGYLKDKVRLRDAVYHRLPEQIHAFKSRDRTDLVNAINQLSNRSSDQLYDLLKMLINGKQTGLTNGSVLELIKLFDEAYQLETKGKSLFDLNEPIHAHEWEVGGRTPSNYWKNRSKAETALYHMITDRVPTLGSKDRSLVVSEMKKSSQPLYRFFTSLGLASIMRNAFGNSPYRVLVSFDNSYQTSTGNPSLLDKTQSTYLALDSRGSLVRE
jgi:hypothetical protein